MELNVESGIIIFDVTGLGKSWLQIMGEIQLGEFLKK
jgi:hypothetical protein